MTDKRQSDVLELTPDMEVEGPPRGETLVRQLEQAMGEMRGSVEGKACLLSEDAPLGGVPESATIGGRTTPLSQVTMQELTEAADADLPEGVEVGVKPDSSRPPPIPSPMAYERRYCLGQVFGLATLAALKVEEPDLQPICRRDVAYHLGMTYRIMVELENALDECEARKGDLAAAGEDRARILGCLSAERAVRDQLLAIERRLEL